MSYSHSIPTLLLVTSLTLLTSCDSSSTQEPEVIDSVEIKSTEPRLYGAGYAIQLRALARYESGSSETLPEALWKTSDPSIMTVLQDGTITAVAPGSALVSAEVDGVIGARRFDVVPAYFLPFDIGASHDVIQGFGGSFSHTGTWRYSYDFVMPIGTTLRAARGGTVHTVEQSYMDWDNERGHENYIIIDHGDGSFSRYLHLTKDGALVEEGSAVEPGEAIALSGNTGFSTLPHLHFDVTWNCGLPLPDCQTIEYWFVNSTPHQPQQGERATAEPRN